MTVCIDTNVLLGMFAAGHAYRPLYETWFAGDVDWAVTTEILLEYEEVLQRQAGQRKAEAIFQIIAWVGREHGTMISISPSFRFQLITADPDDDKFADCAIAAAADWIITEDRHFDALVGSGHKPQPISPEDFIRRCLGQD